MPDPDVQRIAGIQMKRRQVEVVLVIAQATPLHIAVLVYETTAECIGLIAVHRPDMLFHYQEKTSERKVVIDAKPNLFLVVRRRLDDDILIDKSVTTLPPLNRSRLVVAVNGFTVARGKYQCNGNHDEYDQTISAHAVGYCRVWHVARGDSQQNASGRQPLSWAYAFSSSWFCRSG